MSTLGLIVEYNPFHNGHLYHLDQGKKKTGADTVVAVMSGSFLQRGEPALVDKWTRTKMALAQGVDLVVELPSIYSIQAADWFAFGSVFLLQHLFVDYFVFGSESGQIEQLNQIAEILLNEPPKFKQTLKEELSLGHSYPKALSLSFNRYLKDNEFSVSKPNDILGIQYLHQFKKLNSTVQVQTIPRHAANYHDREIGEKAIASATAIRKSLFTDLSLDKIKTVVPLTTYELIIHSLQQKRINRWENFFTPLKIILGTKSEEQLKQIHGVIEGFEQRILQFSDQANSFDEFLNLLKTKRYTATKIQRTLLYILLDLTKEKVQNMRVETGPQYIRVLGFNEKGRNYLHQIKHRLNLPLITKIPRDQPPMLAFDMMTAKVYELGFKQPEYILSDYKQPPVYIKEMS